MWTPETKMDNNLTLCITHECNMNCVFCRDSAGKGRKGFMTLENVQEALNLAKKEKLTTILISGGEPTLHPEIIEIAKMCKAMGFFTVVTTNYTKPKVIKALDGIADTINISLYMDDIKSMPKQKDFKSNLFLKVLLYKGRFKTKVDFDKFIDKYKKIIPNIGFSTMSGHIKWCRENKDIDWLENLQIEKEVIADNGNPCWYYRGIVIDRKDLNKNKKYHKVFDVTGFKKDKNGNLTFELQDNC